MVEDDGVGWNLNLVRRWFLKEEADLILSIPLSLFHPADSLIWAKEPKRLFTTKSAYFLARPCQGIGGDEPTRSMVNVSTKFLWKALWQAKVPGRVKICVWHGYMNELPSKVNLKNRRILTKATCGFCDQEEETIEHALLTCPRAASVWFGSPLGLRSFNGSDEGFGEWLEQMAHKVSKESFELLLVLVWSIWKDTLFPLIGLKVPGKFLLRLNVDPIPVRCLSESVSLPFPSPQLAAKLFRPNSWSVQRRHKAWGGEGRVS
ncbi:uncharacterized protein LOC126619746 [Malus sylvestris]|uniref:uncharacterized protein LOC126619746 n=1 Tax=Malus sylvestris TaxID=3752 RepID=UPI0021ABDDEF|nr:uncharacterized protein LOC126619746 [Malus sylvestris]